MLSEFISHPTFIRNKYFKWYHNICQKSIDEIRNYNSDLHEYHHALPRCMGGTQTVILTFKEHNLCHYLLTKFTGGREYHQSIRALRCFSILPSVYDKRKEFPHYSRIYEATRKEFIQIQKAYYSNYKNNPLYKSETFKFRNFIDGVIHECDRHDASNIHGIPAQEVSRLISKGIKKQEKASTQKKWDIWVEALGLFSSEIPKTPNNTMNTKKICPHCKNKVNVGNFSRWHGEKCKLK